MLADRLNRIAPFHVMEIVKMAAAHAQTGADVISMSIGEPDFTAPPAVVAAATQAMQDGKLQYTPALGIDALRAAISQHYAQQFGLQIDARRIVITAGASGALLLACAALVEVGKDVLMPDPSYPCNRNFVAAFDGTAKLLPCGPKQRFQMTLPQLQQAWDENSTGVLLASPSNPTGTSIAPAELAAILDFVASKHGFAIVDEIYQGLRYDDAPFSALSLSSDVVVINSFSKYFHMTGWRLGWMVVPEKLLPAIEKLAQNLYICPSSVAQHAALACFDDDSQAIYRARKQEFQERRDYIVGALKELGFGVPVMPDGAFYVYADCSAFLQEAGGRYADADALCIAMLKEADVVLVPGLDFGPYTAKHYLRLSYATALPRLQEAVARLRGFFATAAG